MARAHATSEISLSDLTQSTLIFGGLCLCALHFGSMIDTTGHAAMVEEVKVAQLENSIGSETPDLMASCSSDKNAPVSNDGSDEHRCKTAH